MSPMSPRLLRPRQSLHPEAAGWQSRVVNAGGAVSGTTLSAVSKFCSSIDAAGIRSRLYRLSLFCGTSDGSLIAPRVPLYRGPSLSGTQYGNTIDTNQSFVQGDYSETGSTGGITGSGSKHLRTGFKLNELPNVTSDTHIAAFVFAHTPTAGNHWMIGSRESTGTIGFMRTGSASGGTWTANNGTAIAYAYGGQHPAGLYLSSRRSATDHEIYENATSRGTSTATASTSPYDGENWVFSVNNSGVLPGAFPFRLGGYSFGLGLTSSQVSALASAWSTFNTALSRT